MKTLWYTVDQDGNFDIGRGDTEIAKVYSGRDDARLLAHAPELLTALTNLLTVINPDKDDGWFICGEADWVLAEARELITKATGV